MTTLHEQAWELLKIHVGHQNPIYSAQLSRALAVGDDRRGTPETRAVITDLVRMGFPIGAERGGYFVLKTPDELEKYCRELSSRAAGILARSRNVRRAFQRFYRVATVDQPRLEAYT